MSSCNLSSPNVNKYIDFDTAAGSLPLDKEGQFSQSGGGIGYNLRVENEMIGGLPEIKGYQNQPELRDGNFVDSNLDALCDPTEMTGGSKLFRKKFRSKKSKKLFRKKFRSKKSKKLFRKKIRPKNKRSSKRRNPKNKRSSKLFRKKLRPKNKRSSKRSNLKKSKSNKRKQLRGGSASYAEAFNGPENVYDYNMGNREFGCKQPNWDPKCA
jgi:hypothetical protein